MGSRIDHKEVARQAISRPNVWLRVAKEQNVRLAHGRVGNWKRGLVPIAYQGRRFEFMVQSNGYATGKADILVRHYRPTFPLTDRQRFRVDDYALHDFDREELETSYLASAQHDEDESTETPTPEGDPS